MSQQQNLLEVPIGELIDLVSSEDPRPGAGATAALAAALAAGLVAMVARASTEWSDARAYAAQAESLRSRAMQLAEECADAYNSALIALDRRKGQGGEDLGLALQQAADAPLRLVEVAADTAELAAIAAERGKPALTADSIGAAQIAAAAAQAGAALVEANLTVGEGTGFTERALSLADSAGTAAGSARKVER